ncbi:hypothetical protein MW887_008080 [Aspergillus wentii]|nr:hypothetical protein MW887_008080 [Aspergillus wentii]
MRTRRSLLPDPYSEEDLNQIRHARGTNATRRRTDQPTEQNMAPQQPEQPQLPEQPEPTQQPERSPRSQRSERSEQPPNDQQNEAAPTIGLNPTTIITLAELFRSLSDKKQEGPKIPEPKPYTAKNT